MGLEKNPPVEWRRTAPTCNLKNGRSQFDVARFLGFLRLCFVNPVFWPTAPDSISEEKFFSETFGEMQAPNFSVILVQLLDKFHRTRKST